MNLIEHLREWAASTDEWSELVELQNKYDLDRPEETALSAARIAVLLETYAGRMDRSGLVRVWSSSFTPEGLRERAAEWRGRVAR